MRYIIIILLFVSTAAIGQQLDFQKTDSLSYNQFMNHQYNELKKTGQLAIQQDIDFFYLRMRLGIAYYEEKKYENALIHFSKAHLMNPLDTVTQEYMYFTYQYLNRNDEAKLLSKTFSQSMIKRLCISPKSIDFITVGAGTMVTNNASDNISKSIIGDSKIYAEAIFNDKMSFGNIALQHTVFDRVKLFYAGSIFKTSALGVVQTAFGNSTQTFSNNQYQLNIGTAIPFNNGWKISAGAAYYKQSVSFLSGNFDSAQYKYNFFSFQNRLNSYSGSIAIDKRIPFFETQLSVSYSNLALSNQLQYEISLKSFPLGNQDFYIGSKLAQLFDKNSSKCIYSGSFGGKIIKPIWYEVSASYGNHTNYISNLGVNTFNTYDPVLFVSGLDLIFVFKRFSIIPSYRFSQREGTQTHYTSFTTTERTTNKYSTNLIITTLKWNF
jgi:tetratricopeptide (TPR) repeat protein